MAAEVVLEDIVQQMLVVLVVAEQAKAIAAQEQRVLQTLAAVVAEMVTQEVLVEQVDQV